MIKWRWLIVGVVALMILVIIGGGIAYDLESRPGPTGRSVAVVVTPGESVNAIFDQLASASVVRAPLLFKAYAEIKGVGTIDSGVYFLRTNEGYAETLGLLTGGPSSVKLTVLPGMTIDAIARQLKTMPSASLSERSFLSEASDPSSFRSPYLVGGDSLEGLLYPDTYFVDPLGTASELIQQMLDRSTQAFERDGLVPGANYHSLTSYQVIIAASIAEREANTPAGYSKVARVILNRLAANMPLQMDSTVRFASSNYTNPITGAQLKDPSAYNTYVHLGLPPGPIGSVDSAGIQAVLHATPGTWLYFVLLRGHKHLSFFQTFAAQQAAINRYGEQ
jgi:UPF0755 protein